MLRRATQAPRVMSRPDSAENLKLSSGYCKQNAGRCCLHAQRSMSDSNCRLHTFQYLIEELVQQPVYPSANCKQALLLCQASTLDAGVPSFADASCAHVSVCACLTVRKPRTHSPSHEKQ